MKKISLAVLILFTGTLFAYQGQNPSLGFAFPVDGGRKIIAVVNPQNGQELAIGYLTVTSTDSEGALNPAMDQQNVNQLLKQVNQLYVQIYNQYSSGVKGPPTPTYNPTPRCTPTSTPMSGCEHRRSSKWRST